MNNARRKIMVVDDDTANLNVARALIKPYHEVYLARSALQMFKMLEKVSPDLILLDTEMPEMDGYMAIVKLKTNAALAKIPVIFLTTKSDEGSELKGLELGAVDYLSKPFFAALLLKRIENQLLILDQYETIQKHLYHLSELVDAKVDEVVDLQGALFNTMAELVESRDRVTGGHIERTQLYLKTLLEGSRKSGAYARALSGWNMEYFLMSARLHDIGKIAIPDSILNKPGKLSPDEFEIIKTHTSIGAKIIDKIISETKHHAFLNHAYNTVKFHHEKWDGTGYPCALKRTEIPLEGRLMAIADVYDALVARRPYKKPCSHEEARKVIEEGKGSHFDPVLTDVFLWVEQDFKEISKSCLEKVS